MISGTTLELTRARVRQNTRLLLFLALCFARRVEAFIMANSDIELASIHHQVSSLSRETLAAAPESDNHDSEQDIHRRHNDLMQRIKETSLPPVDKGFGPWSFVRNILLFASGYLRADITVSYVLLSL
jgi:uncharacterized membrane protein YqaE (UPF0057 family)